MLSALSTAAVEALLRHLVGDDPSLHSLKTRFVERAGGNPFFLEETVRALVETGVLAGEPGEFRAPVQVKRETPSPRLSSRGADCSD